MRNESYRQFATVRSDTTDRFDEELNKKMRDLQWKHPEVTFREDGRYMVAHISYIESTRIPEDLGDIYEMQNVRFTCQDCPMFKPILNRDGTPNMRVKYGDCKYAEFGRTYKESRCCDTLYKLFRTGEIRLCLAESE